MRTLLSNNETFSMQPWIWTLILIPVLGSCSLFEKVKSYWLGDADIKKEEVAIKKGVDSQFSIKEIEAFDELLSKVSSKYVFDSTDLRDPFNSQATSPQGIGKEASSGEVADAGVFPLTKFPISDFVLSAIIWGISSPRAVLKSSNGKSHIVTIGSFVGNKFGRIKDIQKHKIVVEESSKDPTGNTVIKDIELTISGYDPKKADLNISLVSSSVAKSSTSPVITDEGNVPESDNTGSEVQNTTAEDRKKEEEKKNAGQENDD
jgi:Tfp pilus assembly protein PilP